MALNFQEAPKKKVDKPPYTFIEIFWRHVEQDGSVRKLSMRERFRRGMAMADYYADRIGERYSAMRDRLTRRGEVSDDFLESVEGGRLFDKEDERNQQHREDARAKGEDSRYEEAGHEDKPRVERMANSRQDMGRGRGPHLRVEINPEDTSRMIGSEQVPVGRRVKVSDEPWPLGKPSPDEMTTSAPSGEEHPRKVAAPDRPLMIEKQAEDTSATPRRKIAGDGTILPDAGSPSSCQEAIASQSDKMAQKPTVAPRASTVQAGRGAMSEDQPQNASAETGSVSAARGQAAAATLVERRKSRKITRQAAARGDAR